MATASLSPLPAGRTALKVCSVTPSVSQSHARVKTVAPGSAGGKVNYKPPKEIAKAGIETGATKAELSWDKALVAGFLAGAYIAFAGLLAIIVSAGLDQADAGAALLTLFTGAVFALGLIARGRRGLGAADGQHGAASRWPSMRRTSVGCRSCCGELRLFVLHRQSPGVAVRGVLPRRQDGVVGTAELPLSAPRGDRAREGRSTETEPARSSCAASGCNWLVCLAVWMALVRATTSPARCWPSSSRSWRSWRMGFDHVVANMFFMPGGDLRRGGWHHVVGRLPGQPGRCHHLRLRGLLVPVRPEPEEEPGDTPSGAPEEVNRSRSRPGRGDEPPVAALRAVIAWPCS